MKKFLFLLLLPSLMFAQESWLDRLIHCKGNCKNGQGVYTWKNGDKYDGEWKDKLKHGQGTYTFSDGAKYVGEYEIGKRHGQGTYTWTSGNQYEGEYQNGKRHGQGTYTSSDGNKYKGAWENGKKHGQGTLMFRNGDKYVGKFKNDLEHGGGTIMFKNGDNYYSEWENGKDVGEGIFITADGELMDIAIVEQQPVFPGCSDSASKEENYICFQTGISQHLRQHFKYPQIAKEMGVSERIFVEFTINKFGQITSPRIVRGQNVHLIEEALRLVNSIPSMTPAKQRGKAVAVKFTLPINFSLQ